VVVPVRRRIAEVGRTPSGSEKRAIGEGSGRKPGSPTKPVNGNLTTLGAQARKRRRPRAAKGGRFFEARRSSSRERRRDRRKLRGFVRAPARARCAQRLPMEVSLGRECARLSRGPRGTGLGGLRAKVQGTRLTRQPAPTSPEEATRESEANVSFTRDGRKRRHASSVRAPKWEARREARFSPVSSSHRKAPSRPVPSSDAFGRSKERVEETPLWTGTEPRGSGTWATVGRGPQGFRMAPSPRWEATRARVLEWETVSECRSRLDASSVATPVGAHKAHPGHARPSPNEPSPRA